MSQVLVLASLILVLVLVGLVLVLVLVLVLACPVLVNITARLMTKTLSLDSCSKTFIDYRVYIYFYPTTPLLCSCGLLTDILRF